MVTAVARTLVLAPIMRRSCTRRSTRPAVSRKERPVICNAPFADPFLTSRSRNSSGFGNGAVWSNSRLAWQTSRTVDAVARWRRGTQRSGQGNYCGSRRSRHQRGVRLAACRVGTGARRCFGPAARPRRRVCHRPGDERQRPLCARCRPALLAEGRTRRCPGCGRNSRAGADPGARRAMGATRGHRVGSFPTARGARDRPHRAQRRRTAGTGRCRVFFGLLSAAFRPAAMLDPAAARSCSAHRSTASKRSSCRLPEIPPRPTPAGRPPTARRRCSTPLAR